jgi:hypothetical protein
MSLNLLLPIEIFLYLATQIYASSNWILMYCDNISLLWRQPWTYFHSEPKLRTIVACKAISKRKWRHHSPWLSCSFIHLQTNSCFFFPLWHFYISRSWIILFKNVKHFSDFMVDFTQFVRSSCSCLWETLNNRDFEAKALNAFHPWAMELLILKPCRSGTAGHVTTLHQVLRYSLSISDGNKSKLHSQEQINSGNSCHHFVQSLLSSCLFSKILEIKI